MDKKGIEDLMNAAIEEINYALKSHKSKEVKEFYLENSIRFINMAKEKLENTVVEAGELKFPKWD